MQAVTRQIMGIGQELTYARERVALLDDAPKSNGSVTPFRVSIGLLGTISSHVTDAHTACACGTFCDSHCIAMSCISVWHQNALLVELDLPCAN